MSKPHPFFRFQKRAAFVLSGVFLSSIAAPVAAQTAPASAKPAPSSEPAPAPGPPTTSAPTSPVAPAESGTAAADTTTPEGDAPASDPGDSPSEAAVSESPGSDASENAEPEESTDAAQEGTTEPDDDGWMKLESASAGLEEKPPAPQPYFRTMLLIEGTARYGGVTIAPPGATLEDDSPDAFESRVGNLGGQATLGVMPGGSVFTMAGRLRGGSYLSQDFTRGNMAAEMLFGANFARNARGNEFTHILGGFGVEFIPGENQDLLTLGVSAATVVKGVSFGGGILLGANDEIAVGTLGMQIGWGQLF